MEPKDVPNNRRTAGNEKTGNTRPATKLEDASTLTEKPSHPESSAAGGDRRPLGSKKKPGKGMRGEGSGVA